MNRKHYHVNTFQPGCLNDGSEGPFTSKREAMKAAKAIADDIRSYDHNRVTGNATHGYTWHSVTGGIIARIVVEECDNPECFEESFSF